MRAVYRLTAALAAVGVSCFVAPLSRAGTVTDLNISSYTNVNWSNEIGGSQIAAAPTDGSAGSGLTFGDWAGKFLEVGPDGTASPVTITFASPVTLNGDAVVNALINSGYGITGVNGTITFTNSASATDAFSLVGSQTIRDYNNGSYQNALQGYNTNSSYGNVTTQNWWNNGGSQRLDAQTFVLPSSWNGTSLDSMTITNPTTAVTTNDILLSAVQVNDQTPSVPEPGTLPLLLIGLGGVAAAAGGRAQRQSGA